MEIIVEEKNWKTHKNSHQICCQNTVAMARVQDYVMNRKMLKVLVGQEPIIAITTGVSNRDGVNEKSRCHVNQGCKEFKASYVIMRPAAPIAIARVKWPPGTMGFTAGGRQVSVYLSVHAIATGTTPKKTTLRMKQQTTNALVISYAKWLCWVQENYMNSSRDIQMQTKDFSACQ
jgi:hypothetical protein